MQPRALCILIFICGTIDPTIDHILNVLQDYFYIHVTGNYSYNTHTHTHKCIDKYKDITGRCALTCFNFFLPDGSFFNRKFWLKFFAKIFQKKKIFWLFFNRMVKFFNRGSIFLTAVQFFNHFFNRIFNHRMILTGNFFNRMVKFFNRPVKF